MSSAPTRPDPTDTRTALLDAAEQALLSDGRFSMGAVARLAGVSRQAVYLHFDDRYALLDAMVSRGIAQTGASEATRAIESSESGEVALRVLLDTLVQIAHRHGPLERAVRNVLAADAELASRWAARPGRNRVIRIVVEMLEQEGRLRPDLDVDRAVRVVRTLTSGDVCLGLLAVGPPEWVSLQLVRGVQAVLLRD